MLDTSMGWTMFTSRSRANIFGPSKKGGSSVEKSWLQLRKSKKYNILEEETHREMRRKNLCFNFNIPWDHDHRLW